MKKQLFLLLLLSSFNAASSFAQVYNTTNGLVVFNNGDTLRGTLRDRSTLGQMVGLQPVGSTDFKEYTVDEVQSVIYEKGYYYKPVEIPIDTGTEKKFLLCLAEGRMQLFKQKDYYFVEKDAKVVKMKKQDLLEGVYMKVDTHYMRQLRFLMSDCPAVQKKVGNTNFNDIQLVNLVEQYNNCIDPSTPAIAHRASFKIKIKKGIRAGVAFNHMRYVVGESVNQSKEYDMGHSTVATGGFFINFAYRNKFSFQPELLIIRKEGINTGLLSGLYPYTYIIKQTWLQVPGSLYYTFPLKKVSPFISAGGSIGFPLQNDSYKELFNSKEKIGILNTEFGYRGSAGVDFTLSKKLHLFLEYLYEGATTRTDFVNKNIYNKAHHLSARLSF